MDQQFKIIAEEIISYDDLIELIFDQMSNEDVVEFIKKLELYFEDWEITKKLYNHFEKEMEKLKYERT